MVREEQTCVVALSALPAHLLALKKERERETDSLHRRQKGAQICDRDVTCINSFFISHLNVQFKPLSYKALKSDSCPIRGNVSPVRTGRSEFV